MPGSDTYSLIQFEEVVTRLLNAHSVRDDRLESKIDKVCEDTSSMSSDIEVMRASAEHRDRTIERLDQDFRAYQRDQSREIKASFAKVNDNIQTLSDKLDAEVHSRSEKNIVDADMKARFEQVYKFMYAMAVSLGVLVVGAIWALITGKV